ncbi:MULTISPECIES: ABC transporter permease [Streptomyces]|uniref:FtsX-like permease family protein n=1 Tax=Streptomyces lienomycini TaxID=284035 RepID=A0ABV9X6L9_9ACTN|nr:ABC transporter permease [Streptomyces sp. NBC_00334]
MLWLAWKSLRHRTSAFTASFLVMFFGATMLMSFASMLDTSLGDGMTPASEETLSTMGSVVGGWGMCLVVFAVISTLGLAVRQRASEMALLKSTGATPGQIVRMIVGEAAAVSVLSAVVAIAPAYLLGKLLFDLLVDTGQVATSVSYAFGLIAVLMGVGITFLSAVIAALVTARKATRVRVAESFANAATDTGRMTWKRVVPATVLLLGGLSLSVVTVTAMKDKGPDAMNVAGQASILCAIGFALLAPGLVRLAVAVSGRALERSSASGYLTVQNVRRRTNQSAGALMPIILFTGIGIGILYLQLIENNVAAATGYASTNEQKNIQTLNAVVIGMIVVFACIMLVNTLVASTTFRKQEFGQQRLAGATPEQVLKMVRTESAIVIVTGAVFGTIAGLTTVLPYSVVRSDSWVPDASVWLYLGIMAVAVAATLLSSLGTARKVLRAPAVEAVAAA